MCGHGTRSGGYLKRGMRQVTRHVDAPEFLDLWVTGETNV
jgi:hypothetical protein